jgi:mannose-6-phosphate isomerase
MERLTGQIRGYAWGSRTTIAALQGRPVPAPGPEAELWLGAHPDLPSSTVEGPLDQRIAADPAGLLGDTALAEFGTRLPYLLKVLAAAEPLSLQAHPDAARARERYAAGDPNYRDAWHKPELLVAVEDFDALCGFRPPRLSAAQLAAFAVPALGPVVEALQAEDLRAAVTALLCWPEADRGVLVGAVAEHGGLAADLAKRYPGDMGVLVALLLNRVRLAPGEGIFMPAGNLHSYLSGTGIEIMAASDNVLRGGLTPKPVEVPELLRVLRFEALDDPVVRPVPVAHSAPREGAPQAGSVATWPVPVPDFALYRARPDGGEVAVPATGPRIALCLAGSVSVRDGAGEVALAKGESAFGPAGAGPVTVTGTGEVYLATTGTP